VRQTQPLPISAVERTAGSRCSPRPLTARVRRRCQRSAWNSPDKAWYHRGWSPSHDKGAEEGIRRRRPEREQDKLAAAILEELAADERWEAAFAESQQALKRLAGEALREHRTGRTEALDPDAL